MNAEKLNYFYTFGAEHIAKEIRKLIGNKNVKTNIYRMQACNSTMCSFALKIWQKRTKVKNLD